MALDLRRHPSTALPLCKSGHAPTRRSVERPSFLHPGAKHNFKIFLPVMMLCPRLPWSPWQGLAVTAAVSHAAVCGDAVEGDVAPPMPAGKERHTILEAAERGRTG